MDHETTKVPELDLERLERLAGDLQKAYGEGREMDFDEAVAYTLDAQQTTIGGQLANGAMTRAVP